MIISFAKPNAKGCDCQEIQQLSYSIVEGNARGIVRLSARSLAPPRRISPLSFWQTCRSGRSRDASFLRSFEQPPLRICSRLPSTAEYVMSAPPPSSSSVKVIPAAERIARHGPRRHARRQNSSPRQATILSLNGEHSLLQRNF